MKLKDKLIMFLIAENFKYVNNIVGYSIYSYYLSISSKINVCIYDKVIYVKIIANNQVCLSKSIILTRSITDICSKIMELVNICKYFGF